MGIALLYNGTDSGQITDCYLAVRTAMPNNDRQNIDAAWNAGLNAWNSPTNLVYTAGPPEVWDSLCLKDGQPDLGLCDQQTHKIVVNGVWARNASAQATYTAQANQPITKAGFIGLMRWMASFDTNAARRAAVESIANDMEATAGAIVEPYP